MIPLPSNRVVDPILARAIDSRLRVDKLRGTPPLVQAAQAFALFGTPIDPSQPEQDIRTKWALNGRIRNEMFHEDEQFYRRGKKFLQEDYNRPLFLPYYSCRYLNRNIVNCQALIVQDLVERGIPSSIHVVDVGTGAGATFLAMLDVLCQLAIVSHVQGKGFPVERIDFAAVEPNINCWTYTNRQVDCYVDQFRRFVAGIPASEIGFLRTYLSLLEENFSIERIGLTTSQAAHPTLVMVSNSLYEIVTSEPTQERDLNDAIVRWASTGASVIVANQRDDRRKWAIGGWWARFNGELSRCASIRILDRSEPRELLPSVIEEEFCSMFGWTPPTYFNFDNYVVVSL